MDERILKGAEKPLNVKRKNEIFRKLSIIILKMIDIYKI